MRRFIPVVCAIALTVSACDEETTVPVSEELVGSWSLVQRTCSPSNVPETPASLGHSIVLQFTATGTARVRQDESIVTNTTYELRGEGIHHEVEFGASTFFGTDDVNLVISNDDTLELQWPSAGGGCLALLRRVVG